MKQENELGFAVIGCGLMGRRHADVVRATPEARLVCVQDKDPKFAEAAAGGAEVCATYEDVLARPDVDVVILCLPSGVHADYGIRAARAGKHVITEKPIDIDVERGRELARVCTEAGLVCAVISQNRFADGLAALKAAIERGDMGKLLLGQASVKWYRHDKYYTESDWRGRVAGEGGGVLMNQAIHSMDLLLWLMGDVSAVKGAIERSRGVLETEDVGTGILQFQSGAIGTLVASTSTYPGFEETLEIHGQFASCTIQKGKIVFWKHAEEKAEPQTPTFEPPTEGLDGRLVLFQRQLRNIIGTIKGREELLVKPEEAIAVVAATRAIYADAARLEPASA